MRDAMTEAWITPPTAEDRAAVRMTVLDDFEGWFDADVERMRRAPLPGLAKCSLAQVVDVSGTIAIALVHSTEYVEYLHLVRTAHGWRIINALWRSADGHGPAA